MATIIDPDLLRDAATDSAQNIFISTALRTIKVRNNNASDLQIVKTEVDTTLKKGEFLALQN